MKRFDSATLLTLATLAALGGCSSGSSGVGQATAGGDFLVLKTDPNSGSSIYLNDPINVDFSTNVDIDSASLTTMNFQALDQTGSPTQELVSGTFHVATSIGDFAAGRRLQFVPRFATNNLYNDGGFKAGRTYLVQLVGGTSNNGTVLRDTRGKALAQPITFSFTTHDGTTSAQLFRNPKAGGPARSGFDVTTAASTNQVPLGLFGAPPLEVRLHFDQALNPNDVNVPVHFDSNPLVRDISNRGRVFLEYDDPQLGDNTWIPADVDLEQNDLSGSTIALRPVGVLPNNATIRVIVESTLEDISGESNQANINYNRVFASFSTQSAYEQQWNGIVETFDSLKDVDLTASFPEGQAEVGPGYLKAGFEFEGKQTTLEYEPTANEVVLNTAFTQIVPKTGLPFTVSGGVFNFKNVTIPQGVSVKGTGPNPMVWLCSGSFTVSGMLSVRGGNGARVDTLNSAAYAKAGGPGVCGGGNGGDGTPSATQRDLRGGTGRGPLQQAGKGGGGGYVACTAGCYTGSGYNGSGGGSGGGGGTMATQGDIYWRGALPAGTTVPNTAPTANTAFQQRFGYGGTGCSGGSGTRTGTGILLGGEPGVQLFEDTRSDNNFWGSGINIWRNMRITGELSVPMGGGGGGGGGDTSPGNNCSLTGNDPTMDYSGGGGGGGGGVLIVKALGEIKITSTGQIIADGGNGGGGEQVGSCGEAGGGGAGAGGMVVLMSAKGIVIEAHGNAATNRYVYGAPSTVVDPTHPFLRDDYNFAISADGGVCTTGGFGAVSLQSKYPATGQTMLSGSTYDTEPLGGLGGMGIVQLMVPPGENQDEGGPTNTRLDDNIHFRLPGATTDLGPIAKQQLLAWRGFPNAAGVLTDDFNTPLNIGDNEGDIRPAPTLLPVPFQAKSRARSKWIDTGLSRRRDIAAADGLPRGLVTSNGAEVGPTFEFQGLQPDGYIDYLSLGSSGVRIQYPTPVTPVPLASIDTNATYLGQPAYKITLGTAALGEPNRYVQYQAELLNSAGAVLAGYRILSHTDREMLVDPETTLLPQNATQVQVRAKFFKVVTNEAEGLGAVYAPGGGNAVPIANLRIGFAFHQDPKSTDPNDRYPLGLQNFERDLNSQAFHDWIAAHGTPRYVQWDVVFDMNYEPTQGLTPATPRPELHFLRLPFRF